MLKSSMLNPSFLRLLWCSLILGMVLTACREDPTPELPTMQETLQNDPAYDKMVEALQAADLWNDLDGTFWITLFTPTNSAFETFLAENNLSSISDIPSDSLNNLISYHVQYGKIFERDFISNYLTTPASGPENAPVVYLMELESTGPEINNLARVVKTDVEADDGVIHTIDKVLFPPNIMEILEQNPEFSNFVEMINKADLREEIAEGGPWTLFAPPNDVIENFFSQQPVGTDEVDDLSIEECNRLVRFHLIPEQHRFEALSSNVFPAQYETMLDDQPLTIFESAGIVVNDSVFTLLLDVQGTNGVIHFVRDVLEYE